ncbi:MAG TPA: M48 family peptidase [Crocinitomicaceae bacterium]|nr:M48 family peptidase [Crocinitomicaceae bacterium]
MERKEVIRLFREVVRELGLEKVVRIRIVPMKRKIASFSFKTKTLRINRNIVEIFDEKLMRFIILHELIHFKINDVNHGKEFFEELGRYYSEKTMKSLEIEIIKRLISSSNLNSEIIHFPQSPDSSTSREP